MHRTTGKNSTIPHVCQYFVIHCSGVLDPPCTAARPSFVFGKVAVVSKPTFYGKLRAGVFTMCFQTTTKIPDSHGLFPSRISALFCCGYTHVRVPCRPGAPWPRPRSGAPQSLGAGPGLGQEGTHSLAAPGHSQPLCGPGPYLLPFQVFLFEVS